MADSWEWVRRNWIRTLVFAVASFVICWGWNIWLLARAAGGGGSDDVGLTDSVATSSSGNGLNGVYWLLVSSIGFGLFTYGRERGFANAFGDIVRIPGSIATAASKSWTGAMAMLLWGMLIGLGIGGFMPGAVSGALGAGVLLLALTPVAAIVNNALIRLFVGIVSTAAPNMKGVLSGMGAPFLMMVGEALGLLLVNFADLSVGPALAIGVVCGVVAYGLGATAGKTATQPPVPFVILAVGLAAGALMMVGGLAGPAAADDGGWAECFDEDTGEPCKGFSGIRIWWDSPGAAELRTEARTGGFYGGAGAVLGAVLGGVLGGMAKNRGGWKLPGGGFGTESVGLSGQEAVDVLHSKGVLTPVGEGAYQWAGVEGADAAAASLEGTDLPGGKAARVAVEAPTGADGLVRPESVRIDAEILKPEASGFDFPPESKGGIEGAPGQFGGHGPGEATVPFEGQSPGESKVPFEGAPGDPNGAFEGAPGESKGAFEGAPGESKGAFEGAAESKGAFEGAPGESKGAFEGAPGESKGAFEGAPGESKGPFESGEPADQAGKAPVSADPSAPAAEQDSGGRAGFFDDVLPDEDRFDDEEEGGADPPPPAPPPPPPPDMPPPPSGPPPPGPPPPPPAS